MGLGYTLGMETFKTFPGDSTVYIVLRTITLLKAFSDASLNSKSGETNSTFLQEEC